MIRTQAWFTLWSAETTDVETVEKVGDFPLEKTATGDYICPKCGKPTEYVEAQIDQDFMGNDIYGWWFDCYQCGIGTEPVEFDHRDE